MNEVIEDLNHYLQSTHYTYTLEWEERQAIRTQQQFILTREAENNPAPSFKLQHLIKTPNWAFIAPSERWLACRILNLCTTGGKQQNEWESVSQLLVSKPPSDVIGHIPLACLCRQRNHTALKIMIHKMLQALKTRLLLQIKCSRKRTQQVNSLFIAFILFPWGTATMLLGCK